MSINKVYLLNFTREKILKKLLSSGGLTSYTHFCLSDVWCLQFIHISCLQFIPNYFPNFTYLSEPGLISAGFQWMGLTPARFQEAFRAVFMSNSLEGGVEAWHPLSWDAVSPYVMFQSPIISGSFAKNDLQLKASYESWPPCTTQYTQVTRICSTPQQSLFLK